MQWKPNVTVAAIAESDGRYLLVEEKADELIVFNQPAGHLEKGESLFDAVKREVMEETAWEFEPKSLVGVYQYPNPHVDIIYLRFCFAGICHRHYPEAGLDEGILRAVWLTPEEIKEKSDRLRSPMVMHCLEDYLSGQHFPLNLINHAL